MKNVMTKAWEIAREGATRFGGKAKEYFAEALRMAWEIQKSYGDDKKLLARVKASAVHLWRENKAMLLPKYGTCAVFVKITIEHSLNFYCLDATTKMKLSETLAVKGF